MCKLSPSEIESYLPAAPAGYSYTVERMSPLVSRVWLNHERDYVHAEGEPVRTVFCFIKGDKCYAAKNYKTARPKSVCVLRDLHSQHPYTLITTNVKSLWHLG